jgi:cholesterol transport system auxiliary component
MRRHVLFVVALCTLLAACSPTRREAVPIRYFDFGADTAAVPLKIPSVLQIPNISAPEWLESTAIQYRLAFRDPQAVYTYATGRWLAPPNSLLTSRVKSLLGGGAGIASPADAIRTGCVVRVELEDFSQTFDSEKSSHVTARARASLVVNEGKSLIAQQTFGGDRPAPSADLSGGVTALGASGDALAGDIVKWLAQTLDPNTVQGQAAIKQCKGN